MGQILSEQLGKSPTEEQFATREKIGELETKWQVEKVEGGFNRHRQEP